MKLHLSNPLLDILPALVAVLFILYGCKAGAQTIQSTDLTPLIKRLVDNVTTAEADQNKARSNAVDFNEAADVFEAQARNMDVPDQGRAAARMNALDLRIESFGLRLETARRNAELLAAAREVLNEIHGRVDGANIQTGGELPAYESQRQVDSTITNLNFGGNAEIDACSAQALRSARDFYLSVCKSGFESEDWNVALSLADQKLAAWAASNRATIVTTDTILRRLELEKANTVISSGAASPESAIGQASPSPALMPASISQTRSSAMPPVIFQSPPCPSPSYFYSVRPPATPNLIFRSSGPIVMVQTPIPRRMVYIVNPSSFHSTAVSGAVVWPRPIYPVIPAKPVYYTRRR